MVSHPRVIPESDPPLSPRETLPSMYDLPSEYVGDSGLPDEFHGWQAQILQLTFKPRHWNQDRVFSAMDLNLYYDLKNPLWYKRPDWFGVVGVSRLYDDRDLRLSYVIWQEQVSPLVVVELLSPGTENDDLGKTKAKRNNPPTKWQVYEQILRVPYYVVFSRYTNKMQAFRLEDDRYGEVGLTQGRLLIPSIGLSLGLWSGSYEQIKRVWLRWMTLEGELIPLPLEKATLAEKTAALAQQKATLAEQKATLAEERAKILEEQLRTLGVEPDELI